MPQKHIHIVNMNNKVLTKRILFIFLRPLSEVTDTVVIVLCSKHTNRDFPGGTVVKNPPANARDTGSIPGLERSHKLQSN